MAKITILYLSKSNTEICRYDTLDDFSAEEIIQWREWLDDASVEHPGAPDGWDRYDIIERAI